MRGRPFRVRRRAVRDAAREVVLYGAPDCHLCEEARRGLEALAGTHAFVLREVNIHGDPALERRWLFEIPVIAVDGEVVTQAPVDFEAVRRALGGRSGR